MKYRALDSFRSDFARLPEEQQKLFHQAVREYFLPAIEAGSFSGTPPWPKRLRVHRLSNSEIYSLTWHFGSPDGRATFHLDKTDKGDPILVWRRIGNYDVYKRP